MQVLQRKIFAKDGSIFGNTYTKIFTDGEFFQIIPMSSKTFAKDEYIFGNTYTKIFTDGEFVQIIPMISKS